MDDAITLARDNLTAKLVELRRREAHVRTAVAPLRYLANPWLHLGIAAVIGYRLGRPSRSVAPVASAPASGETLTHAVVRASLVAITQAFVGRALVSLGDPR